jgi:hypothetical protein
MSDPAQAVATRLRLAPARSATIEPWRHWILLYLAALAVAADASRSHFGHVEASVALELLVRDAQDMIAQLRKGKR